jgi:hypothetical protein
LVERVTVPVNPPVAANVMVWVAAVPTVACTVVAAVGLIVKSATEPPATLTVTLFE